MNVIMVFNLTFILPGRFDWEQIVNILYTNAKETARKFAAMLCKKSNLTRLS